MDEPNSLVGVPNGEDASRLELQALQNRRAELASRVYMSDDAEDHALDEVERLDAEIARRLR